MSAVGKRSKVERDRNYVDCDGAGAGCVCG